MPRVIRQKNLKKLALDFQCSVCGDIFTTDEDRKQHLEKEAHGILHEGTTKKDNKLVWQRHDRVFQRMLFFFPL